MLKDGHYYLKLPFREPDVNMPNNRRMVLQRTQQLLKRFKRDQTFLEEYQAFVQDVLAKGCTEVVPREQLITESGKVWYIPHHEVYHLCKKKLRVVFDCGATFSEWRITTGSRPGHDQESDMISLDDPEVRNVFSVCAAVLQPNESPSATLSHFSNWMDLKRAVRWILKYKELLEQLLQDRVKAIATHQASSQQGDAKHLRQFKASLTIQRLNTEDMAKAEKTTINKLQRQSASEQKMADLPIDRVSADFLPSTHVGMDYFGPIDVKRGRGTVKRYGVVFTCLACCTVHLEVAHTLDTDACINALRRFICRRGQVTEIRSDNGTNSLGSNRELKEALNQDKTQKALLQEGIKWTFNPPHGAHH